MNIRYNPPMTKMNNVSFSGIPVKSLDNVTKNPTVYDSIGKQVVSHTPKFFINFIINGCSSIANKAAKIANPISSINGLYIGGLYVINTMINKDIPDERKPALHINNMFTSIFAFGTSLLWMDNVKKGANAFGNKFFSDEKVQIIAKKLLNDPTAIKGDFIRKGISAAASIAFITGVFRFVGPVFAGPVAQQLVNGLVKIGWLKDTKSKKAPTTTPTSEKPKDVKEIKNPEKIQVKTTVVSQI